MQKSDNNNNNDNSNNNNCNKHIFPLAKDKHAGAILKINGKQCNVFSKIGTNPSEAWCNMVGTSVTMSLSGDALLRLCEVEAWGKKAVLAMS